MLTQTTYLIINVPVEAWGQCSERRRKGGEERDGSHIIHINETAYLQ